MGKPNGSLSSSSKVNEAKQASGFSPSGGAAAAEEAEAAEEEEQLLTRALRSQSSAIQGKKNDGLGTAWCLN